LEAIKATEQSEDGMIALRSTLQFLTCRPGALKNVAAAFRRYIPWLLQAIFRVFRLKNERTST
jgi:hypothetical protein